MGANRKEFFFLLRTQKQTYQYSSALDRHVPDPDVGRLEKRAQWLADLANLWGPSPL